MPKKQTDAEKLAALLGIEAPKSPLIETESPAEVSRQAEATILYSEGIAKFVRKTCKECGRLFAHTPGAVAYCSDACRAVELARVGIKWHWGRPASERWTLNDPLVVPPEALFLVDQLTDKRDADKCPVYNHMRDTPEHGAWCWGDVPTPDGITLVPYSKDDPFPDTPPEETVVQATLEDDVLDILAGLDLD